MKHILFFLITLNLLMFLPDRVSAGTGDAAEGKKLFLTFCSSCHGVEGKGDGEASEFLEKRPRDLTDQSVMFERTDEDLFEFLSHQGNEFHAARFIPQFKLTFDEQQIHDIVAYIRSLSRQPPGNAVKGRKLFMAHCASCHGHDGKGGGEAAEFLESQPRDLTDNSYMAKKTDRELYVIIAEGGNAIHGSTIMPRWSDKLTSEQTWDLIAYLRLLHRQPEHAGSAANGERIFEKNCRFCHGGNARGQTPVAKAFRIPPPDLTDPAYQGAFTDLDLYIAILGGGDAVGHSEFMPSWGEVLSNADIWDLVAFIRSLGPTDAHKKAGG